ncbi:acetoacetyl-CoA reductase [Beggiatoa leptomitoformis]|uniref:Acetoacetyl-CoA reductase n=1 Tax=Beggiatoa leptomitoformis TaxID=288004 RepID=A0A2N9YH60_9GAMM|nr:acetoacetyl-CoA reductase [Beggiatoa leptomitoformis]ALG67981.1 acetoacetyl-CoA reductase [Beggiatoa leptomitoformis]AUI69739.1 acetoacetyl-CoA reductase [Beggiatoa leptomitoformis]
MTKKVALVTGGTGGIGTQICRTLSTAGYIVVANWLKGIDDGPAWEAKQKADGYDNILIAEGDVSDYDQAVAMVKEAVEKAGAPIDILVNNAGITRDKMFRKMEKSQWDAVINSNLSSIFNVTKQVLDGMVERGWGRIVNISSVNGQKGQAGQANYSAAKAGMHGFTMAIAQEVASKGVTVNTISPGYIGTAMVMSIKEEIRNQIVAQIPVGRLGKPEEIAWTVQFLADEKSAFITGANISVNGGLHMG